MNDYDDQNPLRFKRSSVSKCKVADVLKNNKKIFLKKGAYKERKSKSLVSSYNPTP
jgi:hypothetical protein